MRITASTLLETVVSMGILGFVLASSGAIYANVLRTDRSLDRTRARLMIDAAVNHHPLSDDRLILRSEWRRTGADDRSYHYIVSDHSGQVIMEQERILPGPWSD